MIFQYLFLEFHSGRWGHNWDEWKYLPSPRHCGQTDCSCCTIPGAICRVVIFIPRPLHVRHVTLEPCLPPTLQADNETHINKAQLRRHTIQLISSMIANSVGRQLNSYQRPPFLWADNTTPINHRHFYGQIIQIIPMTAKCVGRQHKLI